MRLCRWPCLSRACTDTDLLLDSIAAHEQLADATEHARKAASELAALQQELASQQSALQSSRSAEAKAAAGLLALKKLVDEQASDQQRTAELAKMREAEIQDLKFQLSKTTSDLSLARRESAQQAERLTMDLDAARSEASEARSQKRELKRKSAAQAASIAQLEARVEDHAQAQQAHELQFELLRTETAEQMLQAREKWEKELHDTRAQFQVLEDDAVQARRERGAALRDVEAYKALLEAEQESVRKRVADKAKLESQIEQQHLVLADLDKINGDLRAELASTKARLVVAEERAGRTVVRRVLPRFEYSLLTEYSRRSSTFACWRRHSVCRTPKWTACVASATSATPTSVRLSAHARL